MEIRRGNELVETVSNFKIEDLKAVKIGEKDLPFVFRGEEVMYPLPIMSGLQLWYDFSGMTNNDTTKDIARDLSGNGNHGTLQNFNFTPESGYDKNKLLFDGVDDEIGFTDVISEQTTENQRWSVEFVGHVNSLLDRIYVVRLWNAGLEFRRTPDGKLRALNFTNNSGFIYSNHLFNLMEKVHVVYSYDYESATASVTVNGYNTNTRVNEIGYRLSGIHPSLTMLGYQSNITFNSFKVYNRPLTPEEIAHNFAIEKERFGIE